MLNLIYIKSVLINNINENKIGICPPKSENKRNFFLALYWPCTPEKRNLRFTAKFRFFFGHRCTQGSLHSAYFCHRKVHPSVCVMRCVCHNLTHYNSYFEFVLFNLWRRFSCLSIASYLHFISEKNLSLVLQQVSFKVFPIAFTTVKLIHSSSLMDNKICLVSSILFTLSSVQIL
jgi:hypothetical protein